MASIDSIQDPTLKGAVQPIEVYAGAGDPYKTSLKHHIEKYQIV